eukprot:1148169-Pelagomonas_calceolata.AAC.11
MRTRPPLPGMPGSAVSSLVDSTVPKRENVERSMLSSQLRGSSRQSGVGIACCSSLGMPKVQPSALEASGLLCTQYSNGYQTSQLHVPGLECRRVCVKAEQVSRA